MPVININFANITVVRANGVERNRFDRPGGTRLWERVWVPSTRQVYVSQGYWEDPGPYQEAYETGRDVVATGYWDPGDRDGDGVSWPAGIQPWSQGNDWRWTSTGGEGPDGYWWGFESYQIYYGYYWVDPEPYWVDTSYYATVDNSYWAYYY